VSPEVPVPDIGTRRVAVYAIGGNALSDSSGMVQEDSVINAVMDDIVNLLEAGFRVVITHGNGPQVGDLLLMEETCMAERRRNGLDEWVAATQGMIGHSLSLNLEKHLMSKHRPERTAVVLTRVEVDGDDLAFATPTKPIGPVLDDETILEMEWDVATTINGPRRVVASPSPLRILDIDVINSLLDLNAVVFCCGGGGIPVLADIGLTGIAAVIDKDRVSSLLACEVDADVLVISTAVDAIYRDFGEVNQKKLSTISSDEARQMIEQEQLPPGSMGPKVEAMLHAREFSDEMTVVLCQPGEAISAVRGDSGTTLV